MATLPADTPNNRFKKLIRLKDDFNTHKSVPDKRFLHIPCTKFARKS